MRTLIAIALVASASFATLAQAQSSTSPSDASSVRIQGVPAARHMVTPDEFKQFTGKYALTNGKDLMVTSKNRHYYVELDGQQPVEIVAVGRTEFIAAGADMQINFDELRSSGEIAEVVVRTGLRSNNVAVLASR
jgi:hypothetical protein